MRIDPNVVVIPITSDKQKAADANASASSKARNADVVVLSKAAAAVAPNEAREASVAAKLERIRALLDRGEYPVDLDLLASRIVDDEVARATKKS